MTKVFVSHASADGELAGELHRWLVDDGHDVFLDRDLRNGLAVGEDWEQRLYERLRWADGVVCLVTSAYLASVWCSAEVGSARARGSRLLPVLAEPGVVHPLLPHEQYADYARDPSAARTQLNEALRRIDATGGLGWPDDRSPFPGLRPFDIDLHRVFFGRHGEIQELASLLRSPAERANREVLLVVGPSGCGKSSLVRAGLLPVMADEPGWWTVPPFVPQADPVAGLTRELAGAARRLGLNWTIRQVRDRLAGDGGLVELADELLLAAPGGRRRRLLIVVDQFEELLVQTAAADRRRFAELLRPALGGPVQVVATLRPEFLDNLLSDRELADLPAHAWPLRPLPRNALATVIEGPARLAGLCVDEQLVGRLVADTDTGEALPLLAYTLEQLAQGLRRGDQLSLARYEQLGGVQAALIRQAEAALADALAAGGRTRDDVIAGLLRLVTVDDAGRPSRWRVNRDELPEPVRAELDAFVARRLLITDIDTGQGTVVVGVAHEAFLSGWPPLAEAISAAASALRMRRVVEQAAAEWEQTNRPPERLWERGQLAVAVAETGARILPGASRSSEQRGAGSGQAVVSQGRPPRSAVHRNRVLVADKVELSPCARDFLHASIRHDRSRRRRATTVLSVLLVLALAAAGVAVVQLEQARRQAAIATSRQLVARADALRGSDPRTALLLGIAAQNFSNDAETRGSLLTSLTATHYAGTLPPDPAKRYTGEVRSVAFTQEGRTLATGDYGGRVTLWDVPDPARPHRVRPRLLGSPLTLPDQVFSVAFTPDGRTLATGGGDAVLLWDLADRSRPRRLGSPLTHPDRVTSVAFTPDGRTLATGGGDAVLLWDLADRSRPRPLGSPLPNRSSVTSVAFTSDGRTLASGGDAVLLWDLADPARPRRIGSLTHPGGVTSVAFTRYGTRYGSTLATGSRDNTVLLWDVADRARRLGSPLKHPGGVNSVAFTRDGRTLAVGGGKTVLLWNLADRTRPRPLGSPLNQPGGVNSVAFTGDGPTLATGSGDNTVLLWNVADRARRLGPPLPHSDDVNSSAFTSRGRTLAVGAGTTVLLWDLADRSRPRPLGSPLTHPDYVTSVAFTRDGRTLAVGAGTTVLLWDLADRSRPRPLGSPLTHPDYVTSVAFTRDRRTLAVGGGTTVLLWDLADRARRLGSALRHPGNVRSVAFTPDRRTLAVGTELNAVLLWDLANRANPRQLGSLEHTGQVRSVAFTPDGRTLATGSDHDTVLLWDVANPADPARLGSALYHPEWVNMVAFAQDGLTLATSDVGGTVILWDVADQTRPRQLGSPVSHPGNVRSVAFTPDGRTLATSSGQELILWDLAELEVLRRDPQQAIALACSITGGALSVKEWRQYIPGRSYENTCSNGARKNLF